MEYKRREYRPKPVHRTDPYYYEIAYELGLDYAKELEKFQKQQDTEDKQSTQKENR